MSSSADKPKLVLTCEHGGNDVPEKFRHLFEKNPDVLNTHKGYDIGALDIARYLSDHLGTELYYSTITRLLVEANRSENNKELFSEYTSVLSAVEKKEVFDSFYKPYREQVESVIQSGHDQKIIHISIHSFTPLFKGVKREIDLGILYDPDRTYESHIARLLMAQLKNGLPGMIIKANEPYKGTDDGFTTHIRSFTDKDSYAGIEIEVNQKFFTDHPDKFEKIKAALATSIKKVIQNN
jgi:predicted N-formylglutamate amidohydrolase